MVRRRLLKSLFGGGRRFKGPRRRVGPLKQRRRDWRVQKSGGQDGGGRSKTLSAAQHRCNCRAGAKSELVPDQT